MENKVFIYNGHEITFQLGNDNVMLNATQMAKPFGKLPKDYLKTQSTNELIQAISNRTNILPTDLVQVVNGGVGAGTWMHEDIALDFSQWLSIDFKLWCNDRVKELLKHGFTATQPTLENILSNPDLIIGIATQLKKEREEKEVAQLQLQKQAPKINFLNRILDSEEKIDIGQAAKILELPFGRNTLFKNLREKGVFFKNRNEPKQEYITRGYFQLKEKMVQTENREFMVIKVLVTQKGLAYISSIFGLNSQPKKEMALLS